MSTRTETVTIEGMHCPDCVEKVRAALEGLGGVRVEKVEVGAARAAYDPAQTDPQAIDDAIEEAGFSVTARA